MRIGGHAGLALVLLVAASHVAHGQQGTPQLELDSADTVSEKARFIMMPRKGAAGKSRLRIVKDTLVVSDDAGKIKKELKIEEDPTRQIHTRIRPAKRGKMLGLHTTRGIRKESESWSDSDFLLIDENGVEKLRIKNPIGDRVVPAPNGRYAVSLFSKQAPGGPPVFLDEAGVRNKWLKGFGGGSWPEGHHALSVSFSDDGTKVAIDAARGAKKHLALLYDENGNELARIGAARTPIVAPSGRYLAIQCTDDGIHSVFCLADSAGKVLWKDPQSFKGSYKVAFSADETKVAMASGFGIVKVFESATGKIIWHWSDSEPALENGFEPFVVDGLDADKNLDAVALGIMVRKADGPGNVTRAEDRIVVLRKGVIVGEIKLPAESIGISESLTGGNEMDIDLNEAGTRITASIDGRLKTFKTKTAQR
jgi:hypothetical protein